MRAQANLPALAAALLLVTASTGIGLTLADGAFETATRHPTERSVAVGLSERLVARASPLTTRANVLDADALDALDAGTLRTQFPVVGDRRVRVGVDDRTVVSTGPGRGTTVHRVVLVERRQERRLAPDLGSTRSVTLPRRTPRVRLALSPPPGTTIETVRVNGRVALHDPAGVNGTVEVPTSRFETTTLRFRASGPLPPGSVAVVFYPAETTKAVLGVTVGA
ncbi:MAG: hypothetical protein ABEJ06_02430 [Haloarculaceae archaeon]